MGNKKTKEQIDKQIERQSIRRSMLGNTRLAIGDRVMIKSNYFTLCHDYQEFYKMLRGTDKMLLVVLEEEEIKLNKIFTICKLLDYERLKDQVIPMVSIKEGTSYWLPRCLFRKVKRGPNNGYSRKY